MFNEENKCRILLGLVIAIIVATIIAILLQTVPNKTTTDVDACVETTYEETTIVSTTTSVDTTSTSTSTTATTMTETSTTTNTTATSETVEETEVVEEEFVGPTEQQPAYNLHVQETEPFVVKETYIETTTTAVTTTVETTTVEETEVVEETANETYLGNFRITGYIADPGAKTASGTIPCSTRTIAMNKTQFKNLGLKYGDKIRVDGIGTFILEDCGCASGRIDIFRDSEAACYALTPYADAYLVNE